MVKPQFLEKVKIIASNISKDFGQLLQRIVPKNIQANLHNQTFSTEGMERMAAVFVDLFIGALLFLFPLLGWLWGLLYFLLKDSLPFINGQSIGKQFFGLRVVQKGTLKPITGDYKKSILRGVVFITPILNLVDIFAYLTKGERIADSWTDTIVINERYFISSNKGNET